MPAKCDVQDRHIILPRLRRVICKPAKSRIPFKRWPRKRSWAWARIPTIAPVRIQAIYRSALHLQSATHGRSPRDRDAVDFFLNESHEGYCDLYASAMVTMCRSVGIPARVATGYAPGTLCYQRMTEPTDLPRKAPGDTRTRYLLRGDDLHAWAEVYFVGYGWIVFDPTEDTLGGVSSAPLPTTAEKSKTPPWRRLAAIAFSLGLIAAFLTIANEIRLRIRLTTLSGAFRSRSARAVTRSYRTAVQILARRGARRTPTMTAGEYVALVKSRFGREAGQALQTLTESEERLLYADPTTNALAAAEASREVEQVCEALRALRDALKSRSADKGVA